MEKPFPRKRSGEILIAVLTSAAIFSVLYRFDYSTLRLKSSFSFSQSSITTIDPCSGKYIYIHDIPSQFNADLIKNCHVITRGTENSMCPYIQNKGLGVVASGGDESWYDTNQFMLELIFHSRMKKYKCLTKTASDASAVFVPFYAGLDASLRLWSDNLTERDSSAVELATWLSSRREWRKMFGMDHFSVAGRIAWDFRRISSGGWGTAMRFLPEGRNMSMVSVEASSWRNDYAVPYPTGFHPGTEKALLSWQERARGRTRGRLFSFAGAPRDGGENGSSAAAVRDRAIEECRGSDRCRLVDCSAEAGKTACDAVAAFGESVYCLQPPGDSYTRRSIFDSIIAGCIPVFFHPGSAYSQYRWHLPRDHESYSVYLPAREASDLGDGAIERALLAISREREVAMRETVIALIPRVIYTAGPRAEFEDAFDLAVAGILRRIEEVRRTIREGKDPSVGFADEDSYKFTFSDWNTSYTIKEN